MKFRVAIEQNEDGMFVAECPNLPGCISQGKTREEAYTKMREIIRQWIQVNEK